MPGKVRWSETDILPLSHTTNSNSDVHTHASSTVILPGEPGLAGLHLESPSPYTFFNTVTPYPSQTREGTAMKADEWNESTFHEG